MARVRIPVEQLPPPNKNGDHFIQFRVVSDDRNKYSTWSVLHKIKSIGQYRPLESDVVLTVGTSIVSATWDTPSIYNYSALLPSASISHNHSQSFKRHDTDIFVSWDGGNFIYHERTSLDTTSIVIQGYNEVRIVALVATHGFDTNISGADADTLVNNLSDLFLVFDTGNVSLV